MKEQIHVIDKRKVSNKELKQILLENKNIKFVSLMGVDLGGNATDEKIPVSLLLDDVDDFLKSAIQTDGSSVELHNIATLNNAKVDLMPDQDCKWYIDYNLENIDPETGLAVGTLKIPALLIHDNKRVGSRGILRKAQSNFKKSLIGIFEEYPKIINSIGVDSVNDIEDIVLTSATELEFWVKTPNDTAEIEELSTSQVLHEHYWTRTKGNVRTALEQTLVLMDKYGFEPEMGHKEVGGIKAKLESTGKFNHITEQLEVDWKFSSALQAADNELFVRILIQEVFRRNGLEVTFMAKPIDGVAGSGMHIHLGVSVKLKNGKRVNLFHVPKDHFLSELGYGAIMGMLNNYEVMNPFISSTNNALKRLKPGFEAPVCTVTSLGLTPDNPSRNRTVLIGLIRDFESPMATRFELRSPNPHTNTYIAIAVSYLAMLDGILYAGNSKKSMDDLLKELSKKPGEHAEYLEDSRSYRSEEDVFEHFTEEERNEYFGKAPATVYENLSQLETFKDKLSILQRNPSFTDQIIESFKIAAMERWATEIEHRVMNNYSNQIRGYRVLHALDKAQDLDISNWNEINKLRYYLMKDTFNSKCLFTRTKNAFKDGDYKLASKLYLEIEEKMTILRELYSTYEKNLLDL